MNAGPDWLFVECFRSRASAPSARQIYTAFIRVAKQLGHVLDLDREQSRREIMVGLRNHRVQMCTVPCVRCGCLAWLPDWVKAGKMNPEERDAVWLDNPERRLAGLLDFLKPCPGGDYRRVVHTPSDWPEVL